MMGIIKSNDYDNHQWILSYAGVQRFIDFKQSDKYIQDMMNEIKEEHRNAMLQKLLNENE